MAVTDPVLGCGRSLDAVLASADQPPDEHEQTCPYCTEARASVRRLEAVVAELRAEHAAAVQAPPDERVKRSVMEIARIEVRRGRPLPLRRVDGSLTSDLTVSEQVVAEVVRGAADRTAGVHARRCSVRVSADAPSSGTVTLDVTLTLAVASTVSIPATLDTLRQQIAQAVRDATGLTTDRVDISVEDLFDV